LFLDSLLALVVPVLLLVTLELPVDLVVPTLLLVDLELPLALVTLVALVGLKSLVDPVLLLHANTNTKIQYESVTLHVDDKSNPLEFYRDNEILFKTLSQMAKMLFSITASSVASEGSFSNAKDIISDQRNRLTTQHAEKCLMLSQNNRFENGFF
jgi:hypothetical protein